MRLAERVALITGAGSGIGYQTAILFAREGAAIVAVDINEAGGAATVAEIEATGGSAIFVRADVSRATECEAMVVAAENDLRKAGYPLQQRRHQPRRKTTTPCRPARQSGI